MTIEEYKSAFEQLEKERDRIHRTGPQDLILIDKKNALRHKMTDELRTIRAQLEIANYATTVRLKQREAEILELLHEY